jgi:predicted NBD/HSP70 family sugar kinase
MEPIIGAVDIGGTKIAVGVVDADGKVLSRMETPTAVDRSYEDDLQLVVSMLRKTFQDAGKKIEVWRPIHKHVLNHIKTVPLRPH